jgi:Sec-independent protein translocase protein TatA
MNIFGVGGAELVFIVLIMLVVAGPKRMMRWMYILGIYTGKLRHMWQETMVMMQREIDQAGLDIELPKDIPTRRDMNRVINQTISKAAQPVTQPLRETMNEFDRTARSANGTTATKPTAPPATPPPNEAPSTYGTWGGTAPKDEE